MIDRQKLRLQTILDTITAGHAFLTLSEPCQPWAGPCGKEQDPSREVRARRSACWHLGYYLKLRHLSDVDLGWITAQCSA